MEALLRSGFNVVITACERACQWQGATCPYACMLVNYLERGPPQALMKLPPWIPAATVLLIHFGQREESHWLMLVGCGPCRRLIKPNFIFCQC